MNMYNRANDERVLSPSTLFTIRPIIAHTRYHPTNLPSYSWREVCFMPAPEIKW